MKKRNSVNYTDEPMEFRIIDDFLPLPDELALKEETVKITLELSRRSVEFFKHKASEQHTAYQPMIRALLDHYAARFNSNSTPV